MIHTMIKNKMNHKIATLYSICVTQYWFGGPTTRHRLIDNETGDEWRGTRSEARAEIAELDDTVYHTSHNESGRASYTLVRA